MVVRNHALGSGLTTMPYSAEGRVARKMALSGVWRTAAFK